MLTYQRRRKVNFFDALPCELLEQILGKVDEKDSLNYALVCKRWRDHFDLRGWVAFRDTFWIHFSWRPAVEDGCSTDPEITKKRYRKVVIQNFHSYLGRNIQWLTNSSQTLQTLAIDGMKTMSRMVFDPLWGCSNLKELVLKKVELQSLSLEWNGSEFCLPRLKQLYLYKVVILSGPGEEEIIKRCPSLVKIHVYKCASDFKEIKAPFLKSLLLVRRFEVALEDLSLDLPNVQSVDLGDCKKLRLNAPVAEYVSVDDVEELEIKAGQLKDLVLADCERVSLEIPSHLESLTLYFASLFDGISSNVSMLKVECATDCIHCAETAILDQMTRCKSLELHELGQCKIEVEGKDDWEFVEYGKCSTALEEARSIESEIPDVPLLEELVLTDPECLDITSRFLAAILPHCGPALRTVQVKVHGTKKQEFEQLITEFTGFNLSIVVSPGN